MIYPTIKSLPIFGGWKLVAHPEGPAISDGEVLSSLKIHQDDSLKLKDAKIAAKRALLEWLGDALD